MLLKKVFIYTGLFISFLTYRIENIQAQHHSQNSIFSRQDSLRGSITPERIWWDLLYYDLFVQVFPEEKRIKGTNLVRFQVLKPNQVMQIDLQEPMKITRVAFGGQDLTYTREGSIYWIKFSSSLPVSSSQTIVIHFEGIPKEAIRPPWDGGFTWATDERGSPFIATSNQGIGASVWWPNKDIPYDEPDQGMMIRVRVPDNLMNVSNGRLVQEQKHQDGTTTWHWKVENPINNYGVNINIGDYVYFGEKYQGEQGELDMDYYVLSYNLEKAKLHFKDARRTMEALEYWFGPYPFYEDSYKLVEAPYLGMEHQSSVTYGNGYQNGYRGTDLSASGWGLKFDFIIIHESGHEWFANNITYRDVADMWIHESFTNYSESLFLEYFYGPEAGNAYVIGTRLAIQNDRPIIGIYGVNRRGSSDMYYKGGNMLHTIRQVLGDDVKWRNILRGLNKEFYHQTVNTRQIEGYMIQESGIDLSKIFDQYLRDSRIPTLEYVFKDGQLRFRWINVVHDFNMPVKVWISGKSIWLDSDTSWKSMVIDGKALSVDKNFYVGSLPTLGE